MKREGEEQNKLGECEHFCHRVHKLNPDKQLKIYKRPKIQLHKNNTYHVISRGDELNRGAAELWALVSVPALTVIVQMAEVSAGHVVLHPADVASVL